MHEVMPSASLMKFSEKSRDYIYFRKCINFEINTFILANVLSLKLIL